MYLRFQIRRQYKHIDRKPSEISPFSMYAFGGGEGGHEKVHAVCACENGDNCERPLTDNDINL